jgi:hypothetical protein
MDKIELTPGQLTDALLILTRMPREVYYDNDEASTAIRGIVSTIFRLRDTKWGHLGGVKGTWI